MHKELFTAEFAA